MAKEPITEKSEGVTPNLERATLVKLDGMDWMVIETIFTDFTAQEFENYVEEVDDIEDLKSSALELYSRLLNAEYMFNELAQADVIINNLPLADGNKPPWMFVND
jgi:hypothetical protein